MIKVLMIAEHDNLSLLNSTYHCAYAAGLLSDKIDVLIAANENGEKIAAKAANIDKVENILLNLDNRFLAEDLAPLVKSVCEKYTHILAPATVYGKNFMPRLAAILDSQQISDIIGIIDENTFKRPIYAGNAIASVRSSDKLKIITVRAPSFPKAKDTKKEANITMIKAPQKSNLSEFIKHEESKNDRPDLGSARVVISGGRGLASKENFQLIEKLADKLGAAIGASRAAVDAGYVTNDMQVGQTGKIIAPELYIAIGISGAIQHLAGIKDAKVIVAINKDEEAPIFQIANYGLVANLFDALPELIEKL